MCCWMEWGELDTVSVDLANVEVLSHFGDFRCGDVVCGPPDALGGFVLGVSVWDIDGRGLGSRGLIMCPSGRGR